MNGCCRQSCAVSTCVSCGLSLGGSVYGQGTSSAAQTPQPPTAEQDQAPPDHASMNMTTGWQFMQDGIVFAELDHQGGPRGGDQFVAPNWWMGMASRGTSHGQFTFNGMLSLDPATVGESG